MFRHKPMVHRRGRAPQGNFSKFTGPLEVTYRHHRTRRIHRQPLHIRIAPWGKTPAALRRQFTSPQRRSRRRSLHQQPRLAIVHQHGVSSHIDIPRGIPSHCIQPIPFLVQHRRRKRHASRHRMPGQRMSLDSPRHQQTLSRATGRRLHQQVQRRILIRAAQSRRPQPAHLPRHHQGHRLTRHQSPRILHNHLVSPLVQQLRRLHV